jgi:hypothetical protein
MDPPALNWPTVLLPERNPDRLCSSQFLRYAPISSSSPTCANHLSHYLKSNLTPPIGISVRIFGTTSIASGNYSVLLDDTQFPILSARSSFTSTNSLLFFASGLAANISHQVTIRNEGGGTLQIMSGGFTVFSSGDPTYVIPSILINLLPAILSFTGFQILPFDPHVCLILL